MVRTVRSTTISPLKKTSEFGKYGRALTTSTPIASVRLDTRYLVVLMEETSGRVRVNSGSHPTSRAMPSLVLPLVVLCPTGARGLMITRRAQQAISCKQRGCFFLGYYFRLKRNPFRTASTFLKKTTCA